MTRAFGLSAFRYAGLAARTLGWRPIEFWAATPAELAACLAAPGDAGGVPVARDELRRMIASDQGERQ